jgi:hypothetical protein
MDPRSSRANRGTLTTPMAIITAVRPRPMAAAMPMAISRPGMASIMSTSRISAPSTQPPKAPASAPSRSPTAAPRPSATTPMTSDERAP